MILIFYTYHKFSIHVIEDELDTFLESSAVLSFDVLGVRLKSFLVKFSSFEPAVNFGELFDACSRSEFCASFMSGSDCVRRTTLLRYLRNGYLPIK